MGRRRAHNDDTVLVRPDLGLYAVADGAGRGGHVASAVAVASVVNHFSRTRPVEDTSDVDSFGLFTSTRRLGAAIHHANREIVEMAKHSHDYRLMGSTLVVVAVSPSIGYLHIGSVGDSRCYRLRAGCLERLTDDHSLLADAIALHPEMGDEELASLPTHLVTHVLGTPDGFRVYAREHPIMPGDRYLLCSDGLTNGLELDVLCQLLSGEQSANETVESIVDRVIHHGSDDNVAAIVIDCALPDGQTLRPLRRAPALKPPSGDHITEIPDAFEEEEWFHTIVDEPSESTRTYSIASGEK